MQGHAVGQREQCQAFSYASLSNLEEAVARLGLRLREGWQWVWLAKTHWFFATPFGFVIPMKVLYVAAIVHSIRLTRADTQQA